MMLFTLLLTLLLTLVGRIRASAPHPLRRHGDMEHIMSDNIHRGIPVSATGEPLESARGAVIMVHGRGASAESILGLAQDLATPGLIYLAPQANNGSWYPFSFLVPLNQNEPFLSSALGAVGDLVAYVEQEGIPAERIVLLGFSQGACLASEFVARNPRRYGGLVAFSGGLIGPPGTPRDYPGSLEGMPAFFGCSDIDTHIPKGRVLESEAALKAMGAEVTAKLYPGMGHTVNQDELDHARAILARI
jgi:phospholipase/carboxylesterase